MRVSAIAAGASKHGANANVCFLSPRTQIEHIALYFEAGGVRRAWKCMEYAQFSKSINPRSAAQNGRRIYVGRVNKAAK